MTIPRSQKDLSAQRGLDYSHKRGIDEGVVDRIPQRRHDTRLEDTHSRLLWVSADPGCGKSVLSRALVDERRVYKNPMGSTVCYFFKDGQEQRTHGTDALSAVLHQLFENTALITYALPSYRNYKKKLRDAFNNRQSFICIQIPRY